MKIRDRYIAKTVLMYSLVVMLVWLSIYSFFNFLSELNSVGTSSYTILEAIKYIVLRIPEVAYDQASAVILLGCVLGMGHLATTGQLLIFRVSGLSVLKTTWIAVKNALILIFLVIFIGEAFAPALTKYAESERSSALGQASLSNNQDGFWIRDGDNFINVENNVDGSLFSGITIFEVNKSNKIERIINSENANFDGQSLNLNETDIYSINQNNLIEDIDLKERNNYNKSVAFDQDLIASLEKEPEDLSTITIMKQIQFLTENKLIFAFDGGMFKADHNTINFVKNHQPERDLILMDQNSTPILISNQQKFLDKAESCYYEAMNEYHQLYEELKKQRTVKKVMDNE